MSALKPQRITGQIQQPGQKPLSVELFARDEIYSPGTVELFGENLIPGTTDMTAAIQAASDSGFDVVFAKAEIYQVFDTLRPGSNAKWSGQGMPRVTLNAYPAAPTLTGGTLIRMDASVTREKSVIQTGTTNDPRFDIQFEDFGIDFNRDRWSDTTVVTAAFDGSSLAICYTERCHVRRVTAVDAYSHNFDVVATTTERGDEDATTYAAQQSKYVWIEECWAYHAGDDNFTTHMCSFVWINDCLSWYPTGFKVPTNSNCYEVDDGSRNIYLQNNFAIGGVRGLEIKGHQDAPAPYNVHVDGFIAVNNIRGFSCRHIGWYYNSTAAVLTVNQTTDVFTLAGTSTRGLEVGETFAIENSTGNDGIYTVVSVAANGGDTDIAVEEDIPDATADGNLFAELSATAHGLFLDRISVVAPLRDTTYSIIADISARAFSFKSYEGIHAGLLEITDGRQDLDDLEYADGISTGAEQMRFFLNTRNITIDKISGQGFSDWECGVLGTSSSPGRISIGHIEWTDGPKVECVRFTSPTKDIFIGSYNIEADHLLTSGSIGIRLSGTITQANKRSLGPGKVVGYETPITVNGAQGYPEGTTAFPGPLITPIYIEDATGTFTASVRGTEITDLDSSAGAVSVTLPNSGVERNIKKFTMSDASNSSTVTVTTHESGSNQVFTFAQVTDMLILEWDDSNSFWWTVKSIGV